MGLWEVERRAQALKIAIVQLTSPARELRRGEQGSDGARFTVATENIEHLQRWPGEETRRK